MNRLRLTIPACALGLLTGAGAAAAAPPPPPARTLPPLYPVLRASMNEVNRGRDPMTCNYVTVLNNGFRALALRVHLIRQARKSIDIQTFIYANDACGRLVAYELIQAARRGVRVRLLVDHIASERNRDVAAFLATVSTNLHVKLYRPVARSMQPSRLRELIDAVLPTRTNQRMHNKLFLVDDLIGITGGRNIENCYYNYSTGMNFKDRDVLLVGPAALDMKTSFDRFWRYRHSVAAERLRDVRRTIRNGKTPRWETREDFALDGRFNDLERLADDAGYIRKAFVERMIKADRVVFLADDPGKNRRWFSFRGGGRLTRQLAEIINTAEDTLVMQTPYVVLDVKARKQFARLKKKRKGLRVIVSSNSFGATDSVFTYSANYRLRSAYIESLGMEIYEYKPHPEDLLKVLPSYPALKKLAEAQDGERPPFLCIHAKSFVLDDRHTFIGSFNLDPRSANLNTEVGLLIDDPLVAAWVKSDILNDCTPGNSWVIAKREMPLNLDAVNGLIESTLRLTPFDIWPVRNTTSFELLPGMEPVPPYHPEFYKRYRDAGPFPGAPGGMSTKEITTILLKAVGSPAQALF